MSLITIPFTFSAGAVIVASQHNSNFTTISSDYNGNIENVNVSATAAIAYSKLALTGSIVNADINASAAIVGSKLDLTSPGAIGSTAAGTGAFSTLKVGTTHQGDILYDNGTSLIRLTPGTSGQALLTQGAAANPIWGTAGLALNSVTTVSTAATSGNITIAGSKIYKIVINVTAVAADDSLIIRYNADATGQYSYIRYGYADTAGAIGAYTAGANQIVISAIDSASNKAALIGEFVLETTPQGNAADVRICGSATTFNSSSQFTGVSVNGTWSNSAAVTSISVLTLGGNNFSGKIYLYSYALS